MDRSVGGQDPPEVPEEVDPETVAELEARGGARQAKLETMLWERW